jgi:hypothetical protein
MDTFEERIYSQQCVKQESDRNGYMKTFQTRQVNNAICEQDEARGNNKEECGACEKGYFYEQKDNMYAECKPCPKGYGGAMSESADSKWDDAFLDF